MAWGARQHNDGTWRLCQRKGKTIRFVNEAMELGVTCCQVTKADFCETDIAALKKIRTAREGVFRENRT